MTQNDRIVEYMRKNGSITALEAVLELGITRLSARIYDLSKGGLAVVKRMERGKNRYGDETIYARYYLEKAV
ncbi:MAG: hypothetical protein J6S14_07205 [Clostridia bacterium]|nr:hypothetical protein [Clostridia bacterium]